MEKFSSNLNKGGILIFDFRSFNKHLEEGEFEKKLKRELEKDGFRIELETKNSINFNKTLLTERTISKIYNGDNLIKTTKHNKLQLNFLSLEYVKNLLINSGFKIERVLDADSLYKNKFIECNENTRSYLIVAKSPK